jgi:small subunit ribosomal protein S2
MKKNRKKLKNRLVQGVTHLGHQPFKGIAKKACHPSMAFFFLGYRKKLFITDLDFTLQHFSKALSLLAYIASSGGHIFIVNTNSENENIVQTFFNKINGKYTVSYCNSKWIGGTLTNWKQISTSVKAFGYFSTRFDRFILVHNIYFPRYKHLKKAFQGLVQKTSTGVELAFKKSPDILFVVNPNENRTVLKEAACLNIPVIAIIDSNTDISYITYPIPGNVDSFSFIFFCFSWIARVLNKLTSEKI